MGNKKLTILQLVVRIIFLVVAIGIISYLFPHSEPFQYEYSLGKPWKYGRLTAQYDYPIYRSESAIKRMEDSLRLQVTPRYVIDTEVVERMHSEITKIKNRLSHDAFEHLNKLLDECYSVGIVDESDKEIMNGFPRKEVQVRTANTSRSVDISNIKSEKEIFVELTADSLYGNQFRRVKVRDLISVCLSQDTTAMAHEYARLRQNVSSTTGVVLADSRIVDQGEIVTQEIVDKLDSYRIENEKRRENSSDETLMLIGRILLVTLIMGSIMLFLYLYRPWVYMRQEETLVTIGSVTFMVALTAIASNHLIGGAYLVPIGIVTIVLATFLGSRTAYFCHIVMVLLCSFMAQSHFEYLMVQCIVGMVIIFNLKDGLNDRSQLLRICILTAITYCLLYCTYTLANDGTLVNISFRTISMMLFNSLLLLMSYIIIYAFEKMFHFMSGVTLVELCNLNIGLLDRLSKEAPGTFEHSLHVSNISANAAKAIKANAQLVRTGALYHDIGKLWNPVYYTENQKGANPHDSLPIEKSVEIIKRHVSEGLALAKKAKLPAEIQEFIETHHGNGLIKYFFTTWCNEHPDEQPDVAAFSYTGHDPKSKEQAILMMADGVEAASKSLKETTEETITALVNKIVDGIVASGRLNNAKISLREIETVKLSFIKDLMGIYHSRIAYPEALKK